MLGAIKGLETPIGDTQAGVPELRADSRYNRDSNLISSRFSIGIDIINVIVETKADGCISFPIIDAIDRFAWHMANVEGVRTSCRSPGVSKMVSAGWNEGSLKWRNIPRDRKPAHAVAQNYIETSTGLLNRDCSVMPVMLFLSRSPGRDDRARRRRGQGMARRKPDAGGDLQARDRQRRRHGRAATRK